MNRQSETRHHHAEQSAKRPYYQMRPEESLSALRVDWERGLDADQVRERLERHGENRLRRAEKRAISAILIEQLKSVVLIVLLVAGIVAFAFQKWPEGLAIMAVLLINALIGFISEYKAVRSMEALRALGQKQVPVRREGENREVDMEQLVPGDIVYIDPGDLVPADLRVVQTEKLRVNEAALTGESVPVYKRTQALEKEAALGDRTNMLFKGTSVVEGEGWGVVTATGIDTEIGRVSRLTAEAEEEEAPLRETLNQLGQRLALITLVIAALVAVAGVIAGQPMMLMIETAIALGVAAIPEGLPIVATIALARGMWIMARRNALVNRLVAVQTLGSTHVIFTDKTGTLTENRMSVRRLVMARGDREIGRDAEYGQTDEDAPWRRLIEIGVLCNNARLPEEGQEQDEEEHGDPLEIALLEAGAHFGLRRRQLLENRPERREVDFDPDVMMMATYHQDADRYLVAVKGAPAAVLDACDTIADGQEEELTDELRRHWLERVDELAGQGLRLLAMAEKYVADTEVEPYEHLRFLGLMGLLDPPRQDVREAIEACQKAGIRVVMVTGDQPETARAIGRQVGLDGMDKLEVIHGRELKEPEQLTDEERRRILKAAVFARVSPEQKLDLVDIYQQQNITVAMTGDGVNDAPALKKANIGIAMGRRGTDAARQVADMVLRDDAFSSMVAAVQQGRVIFANIRKSVQFMLCTNGAEILAVAVASLLGAPLPLRPLQILYLNVLTDVFPALALGVGKGNPTVMNKPPRPPDEAVLTRRHWLSILGWSVVIAACTLAALGSGIWGLQFDETRAVTLSFLTLAFAKLLFVFNLRDPDSRLWPNEIVRSPWIWGSFALCTTLLLLAVYLPGLSTLLKTSPPGLTGWLVVFGIALLPMVLGQIKLVLQGKGKESEQAERG